MQSRFETRPPWWFMTPRTYCLSILEHGVPVCPAGRIDRHGTLLAFLGPTPLRTKDRRSVWPRTALPNTCWKCLSWQPSFCAPCLRSYLALARGDPFNRPGLIHRPESPLRGGVRDFLPWRKLRGAESSWLTPLRQLLSSALSITVPRNETRWLGDSTLLAKLTLSPRQPKWQRKRVLCDVKTASDWARISQSSR